MSGLSTSRRRSRSASLILLPPTSPQGSRARFTAAEEPEEAKGEEPELFSVLWGASKPLRPRAIAPSLEPLRGVKGMLRRGRKPRP
jgi:hypothetical protein